MTQGLTPHCLLCEDAGVTYIPCPDCKGEGRTPREILVLGYSGHKKILGVCFVCKGSGNIEKRCSCRAAKGQGLTSTKQKG